MAGNRAVGYLERKSEFRKLSYRATAKPAFLNRT